MICAGLGLLGVIVFAVLATIFCTPRGGGPPL
jgi:hypothetical protein